MNKEHLLEGARKLSPVSGNATQEYSEKSNILISKLNSIMEQRPDLEKLIGPGNLEMMHDNHNNHTRFMLSMFKNYNPTVFVDTVLWVFDAYINHGFASNYWAAQLNGWLEVMKSELSNKANKEISEYYIWLQTNIPVFTALSKGLGDSVMPEH